MSPTVDLWVDYHRTLVLGPTCEPAVPGVILTTWPAEIARWVNGILD